MYAVVLAGGVVLWMRRDGYGAFGRVGGGMVLGVYGWPLASMSAINEAADFSVIYPLVPSNYLCVLMAKLT